TSAMTRSSHARLIITTSSRSITRVTSARRQRSLRKPFLSSRALETDGIVTGDLRGYADEANAATKMRLTRISHPSLNGVRYASVLGSAVFPLPADFNFEQGAVPETVTSFPLADVKLLAPVAPSKIVCV